MDWAIASSCWRLKEMVRAPTTVRRQSAPVIAGVISAHAAVWVTGKSLGPVPYTRPRGASSARRRNGPPIDSPAWTAKMVNDAPPTMASSPRRLIVGAAGLMGASPPSSGGSGLV